MDVLDLMDFVDRVPKVHSSLVRERTLSEKEPQIERRSRTHDQIVQAELKLTNVARASLEELRLDYEDFLRPRGLPALIHGELI
jgi:hypothetical protein